MTIISFKNTLHLPLSLFYASQKVFAQRVKILKMSEEGRKGEGRKGELKINEDGEEGNEREDTVRYKELERKEEESYGKKYERRKEKNIKFTSCRETHEVGLFANYFAE